LASETEPFTGVFEGNNHTISNLFYDSTVNGSDLPENVGHFAYIDGGGAIRGLDLVEVELIGTGALGVSNADRVGGLVGTNIGHIDNSSASGTVDGGSDGEAIGGLVGVNVSQDGTDGVA